MSDFTCETCMANAQTGLQTAGRDDHDETIRDMQTQLDQVVDRIIAIQQERSKK